MKKITCILLMCIVSAGILWGWCSKSIYDLENSIVRLHIVANSNSDYDQNVKLAIRDALINASEKQGKTPGIDMISDEANRVLSSMNAPYTAKAKFGKYYIDRRSYEGFVLPEGRYTAVKIELGKGEGKNWWCVLSPPMCFTKSSFGKCDKLTKTLDRETSVAIKDVSLKFKTLEFASEIIRSVHQK